MKALIFNSGTGSRMGGLTKERPKCLVEIAEGVSILDWQLRCLMACGVYSFVITTGEYDDMIKEAVTSKGYREDGAEFIFVNNPLYDKTNYIYSMYLAREHLASDIITLHGDMVFEERLLRGLLSSADKNAVILNGGSLLSEKDFNAAVSGGIVAWIRVRDMSASHIMFPVYKLCAEGLKLWLAAVERFVAEGNTGVYAEEAFNTVSDKIGLKPFFIDINKDFCMEVDEARELEVCRRFFGS